MSSALSTLFSQRCPVCEHGDLFVGFWKLHDQCPRCGAVYFRDPGSWTGSTVVAYMAGSAFALAMLAGVWATGNLGPQAPFVVVGSTVAFQLLVFRLAKAFWVGILFDMEQIYADPKPAEPAHTDDSAPPETTVNPDGAVEG
jgi:uncharacterized protein (DUF983 family)